MSDIKPTDCRFKLIIGGSPIVGRPGPGDIRQRLQEIRDPKEVFVLLKEPGRYMQSSGNSETGFHIEYRDGAEGQALCAVDQTVSLDTAIVLFVSYLEQDDRWRQMLVWVQATGLKARESGGSGKRPFRLVERHGDRLIINKHWCLIALGVLFCFGAAASFFMLNDLMDLYLTWIPGSILAIGVIFLMLATFVDD